VNPGHARITLSMEPEDRLSMPELLLRHEKATDAMIARLDAGTEAMRVRTRAIVREMDTSTTALSRRIDAGTREFVAEMRAQRAALFRILDRLDGGGASTGA
jgi:hypothetical protein